MYHTTQCMGKKTYRITFDQYEDSHMAVVTFIVKIVSSNPHVDPWTILDSRSLAISGMKGKIQGCQYQEKGRKCQTTDNQVEIQTN